MNNTQIILTIALAIPVVIILVMTYSTLKTWIASLAAGAGLSLRTLLSLRFQGVDLNSLIHARIILRKAGIDTPLERLIGHIQNGGNVVNLAKGLVGCHIGKINRTLDELADMDRKGVQLDQFVAEQLGATIQKR